MQMRRATPRHATPLGLSSIAPGGNGTDIYNREMVLESLSTSLVSAPLAQLVDVEIAAR